LTALRSALASRYALWLLLSLPAFYFLASYFRGGIWPGDMLHPTGEMSARLIVFALALTPLSMLLSRPRWIQWLIARRRAFGVAAFGYAFLHLLFYIADMETVENMLAEIGALGIWTGWAAFALMLPLALTSNQASMRALKSGWKKLQRLAYPAALATLVHWMYVHDNKAAALLHFLPLAALELYRIGRLLRGRSLRGQI